VTIRRFESSYSDDEALNRVQKSLEESVGFLRDATILDGKLITVDVASGTEVAVGHGLGRKFKGFIPVLIKRKSDGALYPYLFFVPQTSDDDSLYFNLSILGPNELTVSFWIF